MFSPVGRTQYDLRFMLLGIPVQVHASFWIGALVMGAAVNDLTLILTWVGCLFVSILIHELGHALAVRQAGWPVAITLYHFGGLASFQPGYGYSRGRAIWIAFAGPAAGFAFYGVVCLVEFLMFNGSVDSGQIPRLLAGHGPSPIEFAFRSLKFINLTWGLVNLLPVLPLDGGTICGEMLSARSSYSGQARTHQIGMVVASITAGLFFMHGDFFPMILFVGLAIENYRQYEARRVGRW